MALLKKISLILVLIFITCLFNVSVFADDNKPDGDKPDKKDTTEKPAPIITITKPVGKVKTFNKTYTICGITDKDNIRIELYKKNSDGTYSEFKNVDDESAWDVAPNGFFSIDIILSIGYKSASGKNIFMIKAYDRTNPDYCESRNIVITLIDANKIKSEIADYSLDKIFKPLK